MAHAENTFAAFAADLIVESDKQPSYGCLMAFVDSGLSSNFVDWAFDNISTDELAEDGRESEPHVTILYGFHEDVTHDEVFNAVKQYGTIEVTLGKISRFKQEDQDVIKIDVESRDLRELNALLTDKFADRYTNKFTDYKPHLTLAYVVKDGAPDIDESAFEGETLELPLLVYSYPGMKHRETVELGDVVEEGTKQGPKKRHEYIVSDVYVNGKRVGGNILAYSAKAAIAGIVFRHLSDAQRSNIGPHVYRANELGGYKVKDLGERESQSKPAAKPPGKYWWNESAEEKIVLPDNVNAAFEELADEQRGLPESAMLRVTEMASGLWGYGLEHVGDLTHRMAQNPNFYQGGEEWVAQKVRRMLRYLRNPYGFAKEVGENLHNNYLYRKEKDPTLVESDYIAKIKQLALNYSAEHAKLVVYNRAQWLAREAAVAMGKMAFSTAEAYLAEIDTHLGKDWTSFALEYNLSVSNKLIPYNPGS